MNTCVFHLAATVCASFDAALVVFEPQMVQLSVYECATMPKWQKTVKMRDTFEDQHNYKRKNMELATGSCAGILRRYNVFFQRLF